MLRNRSIRSMIKNNSVSMASRMDSSEKQFLMRSSSSVIQESDDISISSPMKDRAKASSVVENGETLVHKSSSLLFDKS